MSSKIIPTSGVGHIIKLMNKSSEPSLGFFQKSNLPPARENKG